MKIDARVTYLHHSSFAVKTAAHFLIFDYYLDTPHGGGLAQGVINPAELRGGDVVAFASHRHPDHFSPHIFTWRKDIPKIRYVLADDIRTQEDVLTVRAGQSLDLGDISVQTLRSTDQGVAFLIGVDGLRIYHAGDLNWWAWDDSSGEENDAMEHDFKAQIDTLRGEHIDLAFLPCDPRQKDDALLGFDYFMRTVGPDAAVPMHSFGDTDFFSILNSDPRTAPYRDRIRLYNHRGQTFLPASL